MSFDIIRVYEKRANFVINCTGMLKNLRILLYSDKLPKLVYTLEYGWALTKKIFIYTGLTMSENIAKSFKGLLILTHTVYQYYSLLGSSIPNIAWPPQLQLACKLTDVIAV